MEGETPGERNHDARVADELGKAYVRAEIWVRPAHVEGEAVAGGRADHVVETLLGEAKAREHEPGARVDRADGIELLLELQVDRRELAAPEAEGAVEFHRGEAALVAGNVLLLQVQLDRGRAAVVGLVGHGVAAGEALQPLGDVDAEVEIVSFVGEVQVAVTHREAASSVGAVTDAGAQGAARRRGEPDQHRHLLILRLLALRRHHHLAETLGVGEVQLGLPEFRI